MAIENYSLSDLAAATGGNNGFGEGGGIWLLIILFFLIGFNGNGFGNKTSDFSQYATAASQNEILSGQKFDSISRQINQIGDGLSSLGYSQLQQSSANTASINGNITTEGRNLQMQLAECCCSNQQNTDSLRYDMSQMNAATQAAIHSEGEATRALLQQNKIEALQSQINQLQIAQATSSVPRISPYMYNVVPSCGCTGTSY